MFRLFYFTSNTASDLVYSSNDLAPCLEFIKTHSLVCQQCLIVSPNNRRITFNEYNQLVFGNAA